MGKGKKTDPSHAFGMTQMHIRIDDLQGNKIIALLREHKADLALHSPPESCHALDLDGLRRAEITFWSAWEAAELLGCGALKELDPAHGEIKSMRTVPGHARKGVATRLMRHILQEARRRGYRRLSLETGSMEVFEPARALYERFGFEACGPFADYIEDPYSLFMTIELAPVDVASSDTGSESAGNAMEAASAARASTAEGVATAR